MANTCNVEKGGSVGRLRWGNVRLVLETQGCAWLYLLDVQSFAEVFDVEESNPFLLRLAGCYGRRRTNGVSSSYPVSGGSHFSFLSPIGSNNTGSEDFEIGVGEFMAISALYAQSASVDPQDTQVNGLMFAWLLFDRDQEGKLST
eukprot:688132-Pyramimonas_sp.AAC.2